MTMMHTSNNGFKFVLYPKYLIVKGIYPKTTLPSYGIAIFKDNIKEDQITMVPDREQQLYQTYFILNQGKLEFKVIDNQLKRWGERKIVIYDHGEQLGWLVLNIQEYIGNYQDFSTKYYQEQIKLSSSIQFVFELFLASTDSELSSLLFQYKGESSIRTPLTVISHKNQQQEEDIDKILAQTKVIHSELYSPAVIPNSRKSIQEEDDEEEESLHSSIPLTSPPVKQGFSINLRAVPVKTNPQQTHITQGEYSVYRDYCLMSGKDKFMIFLFGMISLGMIYLSMLPIKKI